MDWRLRRADLADAEALSLVASATFLEAYAHFIDRADLLAHLTGKSMPADFRGWIADDRSIVILAEAPVGGAPLGYAVLAPSALSIEPREGDIELLRIYALATYWGSGLGGALMERTLAEARAAGHRRVLLGTHPENFRAHRFYEKHGFTVIGRRVFRVGQTDYHDPIYARDL